MSDRGFTLLDTLMGMFVMGFLLILLSTMTLLLKDNYFENNERREVLLFIMQIQNDFLETKKINNSSSKLSLNFYNKKNITYKMINDKLIRQVNGKGYEVVVNNLEKCIFGYKDEVIYYELIFIDGELYKGVLGNEIKV